MTEIVDGEIVDGTTNENPLSTFNPTRSAIKLIATSSVRFVVSSAITTLVPVETKKEKRKVFIASMVLSGMINEKVKPYVDAELDDAINFCRDVMSYVEKLQAESTVSDVPNT